MNKFKNISIPTKSNSFSWMWLFENIWITAEITSRKYGWEVDVRSSIGTGYGCSMSWMADNFFRRISNSFGADKLAMEKVLWGITENDQFNYHEQI